MIVDYILEEVSSQHRIQPPVTYWPSVIYVFIICFLGNSGCSISNVVYDFTAGSGRRHRWFPPSRLHPNLLFQIGRVAGKSPGVSKEPVGQDRLGLKEGVTYLRAKS